MKKLNFKLYIFFILFLFSIVRSSLGASIQQYNATYTSVIRGSVVSGTTENLNILDGVTYDIEDASSSLTQYPVQNMNFTSDASGWTYGENDPNGVATGAWESSGGHYDPGVYHMRHDDTSAKANPTSEQWIDYSFSVDSIPSSAKVFAWYRLVTDDDTQFHAEVRLILPNGTEYTLYTSSTITDAGDTGWVEVNVDATQYFDQTGTYKLRLYVQTGTAPKNADKPTNDAYWDDAGVELVIGGYSMEVRHNTTIYISPIEINATIRFKTNDTATYSLSIYDFNSGSWYNCHSETVTPNTWYQWWCNITSNVNNYVSSDNKIQIRLSSSTHSTAILTQEDYVQFYIRKLVKWLEISWKSGSDINSQTCTESSPCNIPYFSTQTLNLTITCHTDPPGYSCGHVNYSFLYNKSSTPDTLINETPSQPFHFPTYIYFWEDFDDQQKFIDNWNNYTNTGDDGSATLELQTETFNETYTVMYQGVYGDSDLLYDPEPFVSVWTKKWFDINKTYRIYIHVLTSSRYTATGNEYDNHDFMICPTPTSIYTQRSGSCYNGVGIASWGYNAYDDVCRPDGCFLTGRIYADAYENKTYNSTNTYFIDGSILRRNINITKALVNGSYTLLMKTSILTATSGGENSWLNTRIDYIGVEYFQPNPYSCGQLNDGNSCDINYWLNVSGNVGNGYVIKFNVSSSEGITNQTYAYVKISQPLTGNLIVSLDTPDPSVYTSSNPLTVQPNDTFWINGTVTCSGGLCFNVYGTPRYNSSDSEPYSSIGTQKTDTPFSILHPYGKIEWKIENDISIGPDSVFGITTDSNNNVILVGYDNVTGSNEWRIEKRNSNGNLIWSKQIDFSSGDDEAMSVVVDSNDNIIVCGYDNVNGNPQWRVIKLDSSGNWLWNYTWNPSSDDDEATACGVDSNDNILVGGFDNSPGNDQWVVKKLDSNGNEIDSWTYNPTTGSDRLFSLAVDKSDDSIYVGGDHYAGSGNDWNFAIRKLNSSLDLQWEYVRDFSPNYDESCFGLAIDNNRNVIGAGGTNGCPTHDCPWKFRIVKLKPDGTELWNVSFDYSEWWDRAHCVGVNSRNEIFAAGIDEWIGYLEYRWKIIQLDPNGNRLAEFAYNEKNIDWLLGCTIDKNDDLIVGGYLNSDEYKWTAIKIGRFDKNPCGFMNDGDVCKLSWLINVTGNSGDWSVDIYFNSSSTYVQPNDTDNSYVSITYIGVDASFSVAMPSSYSTFTQITGTTETGATQLDWISFNFTDIPQTDVQPYQVGNPSYAQQGSTKPIFLIDNTGTGPIDISLRLSTTPPSGITIYGNATCSGTYTSCQSTKIQLTTSYQTLVYGLSQTNSFANITLYADLASGTQSGQYSGITLYIRSSAS